MIANQSMRCAAANRRQRDRTPLWFTRDFAKDRLDEAKDFLSRYQPDLVNTPLDTVAGYRQILTALGQPHGPASAKQW